MNGLSSRPDLTGELRIRFPLHVVIPVVALVVIAALTFGFSRVLLSIPKQIATIIALVTAVNVLAACAFVALRPRTSSATIIELIGVAIYPVIIAIVIALTGIGTASEERTPPEQAERQQNAGVLSGSSIDLTAQQIQFNAEQITVPAGEQVTVSFDNDDTAQHNFAVYETAQADNPIFKGDIIDPGSSTDYEFKAPKKGEYYFQCDVHPDMNGTFAAE